MTINEYFYVNDGQTIRVEADAWQQFLEPGRPGQCVTGYDWRAYVRYRTLSSSRIRGYYFGVSDQQTRGCKGPLGSIEVVLNGDGSTDIFMSFYNRDYVFVRELQTTIPPYRIFVDIEQERVIRLDGLPDDCDEGSCQIEFYREGQVIHWIEHCPPIFDEPPGECCCECCDELAAIARTIRV